MRLYDTEMDNWRIKNDDLGEMGGEAVIAYFSVLMQAGRDFHCEKETEQFKLFLQTTHLSNMEKL
jgi:hypothetical protein